MDYSTNPYEKQDSLNYMGDFRGATLLDDTTDPFDFTDTNITQAARTRSVDIGSQPKTPAAAPEDAQSAVDDRNNLGETSYGHNSYAQSLSTPGMFNFAAGLETPGFSNLAGMPGDDFGASAYNLTSPSALYGPIKAQQYPEPPSQHHGNPYGQRYHTQPNQSSEPVQYDRRRSSGAPEVVRDIYGNWIMVPRQRSRPTPSQRDEPLALRNNSTFSTPSFEDHRASRHQRPRHPPVAPQDLYLLSRPVQTSNFKPKQPQRDTERPWVRTNGRNKSAGSTRTGKIVEYKAEEAYEAPNEPIHGPWVGPVSNKVFDYNSYGELKELKYTAAELEDYMLHHSSETGVPLKVWIQKAPADSARRQPTSGSSKCRMAECPANKYDSTITVGSFRLAFDEHWYTHGAKKDPHVCAGFVHLYCAERYLDFRRLCQNVDVEPDERLFNTEPNGKFAASLAQMASADDACDFISRVRSGNLMDHEMHWPDYPAEPARSGNWEGCYLQTLGCRMFKTKNERMNKSKKQMLIDRGVKKSNQLSHLGDVEKAVRSRNGATEKRRRLARENPNLDDSEDEERPRSAKRVRLEDPTEAVAGMGTDRGLASRSSRSDGKSPKSPRRKSIPTPSPTPSNGSRKSSRELRRRKSGLSYAETSMGSREDGLAADAEEEVSNTDSFFVGEKIA